MIKIRQLITVSVHHSCQMRHLFVLEFYLMFVIRLLEVLMMNQQEVVRLKFQNGFSYKEISRITALSVSNVGFLIHTAVARLRTEFAAQRP